jgi:hypothetical protein
VNCRGTERDFAGVRAVVSSFAAIRPADQKQWPYNFPVHLAHASLAEFLSVFAVSKNRVT